jgi:cytochrome b561
MNTTKKYPTSLIVIHWLTVFLLVFVFVKGKSLENIECHSGNVCFNIDFSEIVYQEEEQK